MSYLPLYHTFGRFLEMMGCVFWGAVYHFAENPSIDVIARQMQEVRPTVFISIPARGQIQNVKRPWARINYSSERWNVCAKRCNLRGGFLWDAPKPKASMGHWRERTATSWPLRRLC